MECARQVMKGIKSKTDEVGAKVSGGQTVMNPWFLVGGTAITTVQSESVICSTNFLPGDKVILTKPLGTNICGRIRDMVIDETLNMPLEQAEELENNAVESMATLNV